MAKSNSPFAISHSETEHAYTVLVKKPSMRYIDEFLRLRCATDILALGVFPNAKEISESFAAYHAIFHILRRSECGNKKNVCVDVGSGTQPRTAALCAFMTRWRTIAVDPRLDVSRDLPIHDYSGHRTRVQDLPPLEAPKGGRLIILAVHAHVNLVEIPIAPEQEVIMVGIPCCEPLDHPLPPVREYDDWGCLSVKRNIRIWHFTTPFWS